MLRLVMVVAILLSTSSTAAQDVELKLEAPSDICLPLSVHQAILADLLELRGHDGQGGLRLQVKLLDEQLQLHAEQIRDLTLSRDLAVQSQNVAMRSLKAAIQGKREAEEARDAWHRSPVLWLTTGVVGALTIAIIADKLQR